MLLTLALATALTATPVTPPPRPDPLLTLDDADFVYPRLSPDGTRLLVARAFERADGTETTDVLVVDVASGSARELISRSEAEANETYETFVIGLGWVDDRTATVSLSDGDVGGTDLVVDVFAGRILQTTHDDEEDLLLPSEFRDVAADARSYARYFSREELERSLAASALRLPSGRVVVQKRARQAASQPIFLIDPAARRIRRIGAAREGETLWSAVERGRDVFLLSAGEDGGRVAVYRGRRLQMLGTWSAPMRDECPRLERAAERLLVFSRPCRRSAPASGRVWELTRSGAVERTIDPHLDELSFSADGSRIAAGVWRDGRRVVYVFETASVLPPAD